MCQNGAPQTPYPVLGFKTLEQTDSATTEIRGPPHPLSRTRVTTLGQTYTQTHNMT